MTESAFLPPGYKPPKKQSRYLKLMKGETRVRILAAPLLGYVAWVSQQGKRKPVRRSENTFQAGEYDPKQEPKHFWAMPVWEYASGQVKVWELTQVSIMGVVRKLSVHKKWGAPFDYDVVIQATGDGMEREYSVIPEPKEELDINAADRWREAQATFDITRLMDGGDPFGDQGSNDEFSTSSGDDDIPF